MTQATSGSGGLSPGIHHGISFEDYRALDAANKSSLDDIIDLSPMHCRYRRDNPQPDSPALLMGRALHALVLEHGDYESRFVVAGQCAAIQKNGRPCDNAGKHLVNGGWYCGKHISELAVEQTSSVTVLTADQDKQAYAMADAINRVEPARKFIGDIGEGDGNEITLIWIDKETELLCKARLDMGRWSTWESVGDIKTTQCASTSEFERSITTFKYHRQAAFYQDGAKSLGVPFKHFPIIAVEKDAPHGVGLFRLKDLDIGAGREEIRRGLRRYAECKSSGRWPGYQTEFADIGITDWAMKKILNPKE